MGLLDQFEKMADLAVGYRNMLESKGFSPTVAEQLAANVLATMQMKAFQ
jgi:hypothetical protein